MPGDRSRRSRSPERIRKYSKSPDRGGDQHKAQRSRWRSRSRSRDRSSSRDRHRDRRRSPSRSPARRDYRDHSGPPRDRPPGFNGGGRRGGGFGSGRGRGRGNRDNDDGPQGRERWGKAEDIQNEEESMPEKEPEPDFGLSGVLAAETNTIK